MADRQVGGGRAGLGGVSLVSAHYARRASVPAGTPLAAWPFTMRAAKRRATISSVALISLLLAAGMPGQGRAEQRRGSVLGNALQAARTDLSEAGQRLRRPLRRLIRPTKPAAGSVKAGEAVGLAALKRSSGEKRLEGDLFVDGASPCDVKQGKKTGTCWVSASQAAMANARPDLVESMFEKKPGGWTMRFGNGYEAPVDDVVPRNKNLYGRSRQKDELWVTVQEKGVAQYFGGAEAIARGGYPRDALRLLAGQSRSMTLKRGNEDAVWRALSDNVRERYPMVASTRLDLWTATVGNVTGLAADHAYAVLDVREDKVGRRRVYLYNPWGGSILKHGEFSIPFDQFLKHFGSLDFGLPSPAPAGTGGLVDSH